MKKFIKMMAVCVLGMSVMAGCGSEDKKEDKIPVVSVAQIVEHKSLNTIRDSFKEEMKELGYVDGENIKLSFKDAGGQSNTLDSIMSTFAGNKSDVIVAIATPTAMSAAKYSKDIPIVFSAVSDPVGAGLMKDLNKPENNITGTSDEIQVDQILDLALKVNPDLKTLGFIYNTSEANSVSNLEKAKKFCEEHNITLKEGSGANITEIQSAVSVLTEECDAIFAPNDNTVASSMSALVNEANKKKVPVYTGADSMVSDGGFASVGIDYTNLGKETAKMVDAILKGKDVKDLPVKVFKTDLNIYVNEKTMKELGITLPEDVAKSENLVKM
ncbi:ABC transporter substrate binding protein [Amedibacillus sp. YH-ame10]